MTVFAIGDLHLPGNTQKPMDIFGKQWDRHFDTISRNWKEAVSPEDVVLIPGDISWAMQLEEAREDLLSIAALPGKKLMIRGNHDYWWSSVGKIRAFLPENLYVLQNDAMVIGDTVFCGCRGWNFPTAENPLEEQDEKIYRRELLRLEMTLTAAMKLPHRRLVVMTHFPPMTADAPDTGFTAVLERFPVDWAVYGHLHGNGIKTGFSGEKNGIEYRLVSCDALEFAPMKLFSE